MNQMLVKKTNLYFGFLSFILLGMLFFSSSSLAQLNTGGLMAFDQVSNGVSQDANDAYLNQNSAHALETPDLKTSQEAFLYGVATPHVISAQTLGDIMGGQNTTQNRSDVTDYTVQPGDTVTSIAQQFGFERWQSVAQPNDLSKNSILKTGDSLVILPADGILYIVKSGDTIESIAARFKAKTQDILDYNNGDSTVYVGQPVFVLGGVITQQAPARPAANYAPLPNSFFILPLLKFVITQGLHYFNAVDMATSCGDPIYAAASGVVEKAAFDRRYGYYIVIAHENGALTYYGHESAILVSVGSHVTVGDQIGLVGRTGIEATGCHVHFQVMGGYANPLAGYPVHTQFLNGSPVH